MSTEKVYTNSPTNTIHGKNAQLSMRLDTHISPGSRGRKEACNDTCQGLSPWADRDGGRSRKDDQDRLVSKRRRDIFVVTKLNSIF